MPPTRDIVVIGGSAGAVEGMLKVAASLPAILSARVFLVVHVPPTVRSLLPQLLERSGHLMSRHARDEERTEPSVIYVAPPDHHLLVGIGSVRVVQGPRENGHRPAVDPLFRSAATSYGSRVIAVVLSGNLDDGSAGARAVAEAGGVVIVQDPSECLYPGMPSSALASVPDAEVFPLEAIGSRIAELVVPRQNGASMSTPERTTGQDPVEMDVVASQDVSESGVPSRFTCPECHGAIFEIDVSGVPKYRCRVGHAYSAESLLAGQNGSLEAALWAALRALEEASEMTGRLAQRAEQRGSAMAARSFRRSEAGYMQRAHVIRGALNMTNTVPDLDGDDLAGTI